MARAAKLKASASAIFTIEEGVHLSDTLLLIYAPPQHGPTRVPSVQMVSSISNRIELIKSKIKNFKNQTKLNNKKK